MSQTSEPSATPTLPQLRQRGRARASLFVRIYATFVLSVLGFTLLAGLLIGLAARTWGEQRVREVTTRIELEAPALIDALDDPSDAALRETVARLEREFDARVTVYERLRGRRLAPPRPRPADASEPPPPPPPQLSREELIQLRRGQPVVQRSIARPPLLLIPVFEGEIEPLNLDLGDAEEREGPERADVDPSPTSRRPAGSRARPNDGLVALIRLEPRTNPTRTFVLIGLLLLGVLAIGALPLARSLTHRLARLEKSTRQLALGDFSHRAEFDGDPPRDEIDRLALAFNEMAERLEALLKGQRTLLANVSHELRTPIARMRVLVELLGQRLTKMDADGEITDAASLARLHQGLAEMDEDLGEVETLINDLLTSGRLELGRGNTLQNQEIDVCELCQRAASRFDAKVECAGSLRVDGDPLLLERLLRNLLTNARRHCPEGTLVVRALREDDATVIEVEDEGPGIAPRQRSLIFEPFARLDAARARDQGGVGLGLYLCRQIAAAHGGTLHALERRDGRPGARFVLKL